MPNNTPPAKTIKILVEDLRELLPTVEISDRPELLAEVSNAIVDAWTEDQEWAIKIPIVQQMMQ